MKKVKLAALFVCSVLLLTAIAPATWIKKTDLIAQVCISGYRSEDYILQITDNGAIFAFRGKLAFGPRTTDDGEFWFEEIYEAKSRRLEYGEAKKIKALIEDVKNYANYDCGCHVERGERVLVMIDDVEYYTSYECLSFDWDKEESLRLAYNLVLMSPIKSGPEDFNEDIIKVADRAINGYIDEDGEKIDPITWRK